MQLGIQFKVKKLGKFFRNRFLLPQGEVFKAVALEAESTIEQGIARQEDTALLHALGDLGPNAQESFVGFDPVDCFPPDSK